jgi:hypothetical protein
MAVRRPRKARKPRPPRQPQGTYRGAVADGEDLEQAANVIAEEARRLAGWSQQIHDGIVVEGSGDTVTVWTEAGPAWSAETGARHPLFGDRKRWYPPSEKQKPFLAPAADAKASDAMDRYAQKFERQLRKAGFE